MNEQEIYNDEATLDALLDCIRHLPKPSIKLLNFERYLEMLECADNLQKLLFETHTDATLTTELEHGFNLGCISVELPELTIPHPQSFAGVVSKADNFEIYPLVDGRLRLDITFYNVLAGYYEEAL